MLGISIIQVKLNVLYYLRGMTPSTSIKTKACSCCKNILPATTDFFRLRNKRSFKKRLTSWCIHCYKEYNQQRSVKERKRQKVKEWKKLNPEKLKTQKHRNYLRLKRKKRVSG